MKEISVVLPAYNEKDNIRQAVESAHEYLKRSFRSFEIVVVNDGATDGTGEIVKKMCKSRKWLRLISHDQNQGYGATLVSGFSTCRGKLIFYTDSDNQFDINDLDLLLPLLNDFDIVAGFRVRRQDPLSRIFVAWVYNWMIRLVLGLKIKDVDCSFKLYKSQVFNKITLKSKTGLIDAEILLKAKKAGFRIGQVGVRHFPRLKGQTIYEMGKRNNIFAFVNPKVPIEIFKEIKKLWNELR